MKINDKTIKILQIFNENKLLILKILYDCKQEQCGCDLIQRLNIPKNLLSYHIKTLREIGFIEETQCGKMKNYRITPQKLEKVEQILKLVELI